MCPAIDSGHLAANQKDNVLTLKHAEKMLMD